LLNKLYEDLFVFTHLGVASVAYLKKHEAKSVCWLCDTCCCFRFDSLFTTL